MCFTRHTALIFLQWNHVYLRHLLVEYWLIPWVDMLTGCWLIHWLMHNPHTDGVAADMLTEIGGLSTNTRQMLLGWHAADTLPTHSAHTTFTWSAFFGEFYLLYSNFSLFSLAKVFVRVIYGSGKGTRIATIPAKQWLIIYTYHPQSHPHIPPKVHPYATDPWPVCC